MYSLQHVYMGCLFITLVVSLLLVAGVLSYVDPVLPPTHVHGLSLYYTGCIFIACCRCFVLYRPCFLSNTCTWVVSLLLVAGVLSYVDPVLPPTRVHGLYLYYTGCIFIACCRCFDLYGSCFPSNTCTWVVSLLHWLYLYCLLPVFCPT